MRNGWSNNAPRRSHAVHFPPHVFEVCLDRSTMRSLLGGSKEKLVHDPGAKGPEGEGEAAMTMMATVYAVALGLLIYGTYSNFQVN